MERRWRKSLNLLIPKLTLKQSFFEDCDSRCFDCPQFWEADGEFDGGDCKNMQDPNTGELIPGAYEDYYPDNDEATDEPEYMGNLALRFGITHLSCTNVKQPKNRNKTGSNLSLGIRWVCVVSLSLLRIVKKCFVFFQRWRVLVGSQGLKRTK